MLARTPAVLRSNALNMPPLGWRVNFGICLRTFSRLPGAQTADYAAKNRPNPKLPSQKSKSQKHVNSDVYETSAPKVRTRLAAGFTASQMRSAALQDYHSPPCALNRITMTRCRDAAKERREMGMPQPSAPGRWRGDKHADELGRQSHRMNRTQRTTRSPTIRPGSTPLSGACTQILPSRFHPTKNAALPARKSRIGCPRLIGLASPEVCRNTLFQPAA